MRILSIDQCLYNPVCTCSFFRMSREERFRWAEHGNEFFLFLVIYYAYGLVYLLFYLHRKCSLFLK